jgi:hypothetical protein
MILYLILLFVLLGMSIREGFKSIKTKTTQSTQCKQRTTCQQCHDDGKSPDGVCYWCKDKGCQSPDDYYDSNTCSSDLANC